MPKKHRMGRKDFEYVAKNASMRVHGSYFSAAVAPLQAGAHAQCACVVSKKVARRAVERSRIKRRCRNIARPHLKAVRALVIVLHAKREAARADFVQMKHDVENIFERIQARGTTS